MYIEKVIRGISIEEREEFLKKDYPLALIAGPPHYLKQIFDYLKDRLSNVVYQPRPDMTIKLIDGYLCLLKDKKSNLGWRVILGLERADSLEGILLAARDEKIDLTKILDSDFLQEHLDRLDLLILLKADLNSLSEDKGQSLEKYFGIQLHEIQKLIRQGEEYGEDLPDITELERTLVQEPVIRLTTYNGCKGLSAGYIFVTGLDQGEFPRGSKPTDTEVCQFIVALTRTRKQCHLISTGRFAVTYPQS